MVTVEPRDWLRGATLFGYALIADLPSSQPKREVMSTSGYGRWDGMGLGEGWS